VSSRQAQAVGLKQSAVAFVLPFELLVEKANPQLKFIPVPKFPAIELDLSISVSSSAPWAEVEAVVRKAGGTLLRSIELFDIYDHDGQKSFAFHLEFRDDEKTLEMKDVEPLQKSIIEALEKELAAKLRK